jgi:hypothetical protein
MKEHIRIYEDALMNKGIISVESDNSWMLNDDTDAVIDAMREAEQQTREEMFEFVEYCIINVSVAKKGYCTMSDNFDKDFVSKEELFDYWESLNK